MRVAHPPTPPSRPPHPPRRAHAPRKPAPASSGKPRPERPPASSRSIGNTPLEIFCVCAPGLEPLLAQEIAALDLHGVSQPGGVVVRGGARELLLLNLWLRTAGRVLVRLGSFTAKSFPELVQRASLLPFERVLRPGQPVALKATCRKSRLYHSGGVVERVHAALEARLGAKCALLRASADDEEPPGEELAREAGQDGARDAAAPASAPQLLLVRFENDVCTVSADASGALLHRRGYRTQLSRAPLRETLAAALLLAAGYRGGPLLDPCCGGGTIPIEAALIALGRAPGLQRAFACEAWAGFPAGLSQLLRAQARASERAPETLAAGDLEGSDLDPSAIAAAQANVQSAGLSSAITFRVRPLASVRAADLHPGTLLASNPPYGKRVGAPGPELVALWSHLGALARAQRGPAALLCPSNELARIAGAPLHAGLRTQNGGLPVSFLLSRT